jgi:hypothetical protein
VTRDGVAAHVASGAIVAAIAVFSPARVAAQDDIGQPADQRRVVSGLFGRHDADDNANASLDATGSLLGGYDTYRAPGIPAAVLGPGRDVYSAQGALSYQLNRSHASYAVAGGGGYSYWPNSGNASTRSLSVSASAAITVNPRLSFSASGDVHYAPDFFLGDFGQTLGFDVLQLNGGAPLDIGTPTGLRGTPGETIGSYAAADAAIRVTERSTLTLTYGFRDQTLSDFSGGLRTQSAGARFTRRLTDHASLVLGYVGGRGSYKNLPGTPIQTHDIEAGVEYGRPLQLSRKTTFTFRTGSTLMSHHSPFDPAGAGGGMGLYLTGMAALNQEIRGTWSAHLVYRRGVQFIEGLPTPFLSDIGTASIDGYVGRRMYLSAASGYMTGGSTDTAVTGRFTSVYAAAQARYALTQYIALTGSYAFRRYDFGSTLPAVTGLATELDQRGARAGITVWLPIWR